MTALPPLVTFKVDSGIFSQTSKPKIVNWGENGLIFHSLLGNPIPYMWDFEGLPCYAFKTG